MRWVAFVLTLAAAACVAGPREASRQELALRQQLLETALGQIGRPYRYGGGDGEGFDCSGLVQYVYLDAGVAVPRTAAGQMRAGEDIDADEALPGDLMFFDTGSGAHVAIYVGDGRVVHAPSRGKDVTVTAVDEYWSDHRVATVKLVPFD